MSIVIESLPIWRTISGPNRGKPDTLFGQSHGAMPGGRVLVPHAPPAPLCRYFDLRSGVWGTCRQAASVTLWLAETAGKKHFR